MLHTGDPVTRAKGLRYMVVCRYQGFDFMFVGRLFKPACHSFPTLVCSLPEQYVYPRRNLLPAMSLPPMEEGSVP